MKLSKKKFFTKCCLRIPCHLLCTYENTTQPNVWLMAGIFTKPIWQPTQEANALLIHANSVCLLLNSVGINQFSTSPEKHGKNPGSLTGSKK